MKKTKLLMPIFGITTATGIITPTMVSCNEDSKKLEIDVTNKNIITTVLDSQEFEFVWNSYSKTSKNVLSITKMSGGFGFVESGTRLKFVIMPSAYEALALDLSSNGKAKMTFTHRLESNKVYSFDFSITYKINDGNEKELSINDILVTYKPQ